MRTQLMSLAGTRAAGSVLQALMTIALARWVSPVEFGSIAVTISATVVLLIFADYGMSSYVPRVRAQGRGDLVAVALRFNAFTTAVSIVIAAVAVVAVEYSRPHIAIALVLVAASFCLEKNVDTVISIAIADGSIAISSISILLRRLVAVGFFFAAACIAVDPALGYGSSLFVGSIVGVVHSRFSVTSRLAQSRDRRSAISGLMREGWPYFVTNASGQLRFLDTVVVGRLLDASSAGLYAVGQRLTNPLLIIPGALSSLILPHSTRIDVREAKAISLKLCGATGAFLVPLIIASFLAGSLVKLIFGEEYVGGVPSLQWLLIGLPFVALASPLGSILQGQGDEKFVARNGVWFAVINLILMILGAYCFGIVGVAIGIAVSYAVKSILLLFRIQGMVAS